MPNQDIKNYLIEYEHNWFKNNFVIGIQMKVGDSDYIDESNDYLKFINCASEIENDYILKIKKTDVSFKWFIATDSDKIRNLIFEHYKEKSFTSNGTLDHTSLGLGDGFRRAVLDVELLSKCDEIIVTSGSTFGWLAAMKTLRMPYYVSGSSDKMVKCTREDMRRISANQLDTASF
jgi:hypothetical protein